ncbi:MAG: SUMF1/EgtB/PvdO family nonheme iron enzyme [Kiritimatiellae bacterium]|nr:SUMF1/EgtB/PvdO family nonheme iron enzyme [Kiritimatiellia bacterium]
MEKRERFDGGGRLQFRRAVASLIVLGASALHATVPPQVSDVRVELDPTNHVVNVTYALDREAIVTVAFESGGAAVDERAVAYVSGDVNRVVPATDGTERRTIRWNADAGWRGHSTDALTARVTAWDAATPPDIMVVDVTCTNSVRYYVSTNALPEGGLTNDIYRMQKLVLKKIAAKGVTWQAGSTYNANEVIHNVTLTNDYYMGVFAFTQWQWVFTCSVGSSPAWFKGDTRPVENVSYVMIRETKYNDNAAEDPTYQYPNDPHPQSLLGILRRESLLPFDLPSEMEWEYAANGGYDGTKLGDGSAANQTNMKNLGRIASDFTSGTPDSGTAVVGCYKPNAFGLYDMNGNVWEWCLDRYMAKRTTLADGDAHGAVNTVVENISYPGRLARGGRYSSPWQNARSQYRWAMPKEATYRGNNNSDTIGFRVCVHIGEGGLTPTALCTGTAVSANSISLQTVSEVSAVASDPASELETRAGTWLDSDAIAFRSDAPKGVFIIFR